MNQPAFEDFQEPEPMVTGPRQLDPTIAAEWRAAVAPKPEVDEEPNSSIDPHEEFRGALKDQTIGNQYGGHPQGGSTRQLDQAVAQDALKGIKEIFAKDDTIASEENAPRTTHWKEMTVAQRLGVAATSTRLPRVKPEDRFYRLRDMPVPTNEADRINRAKKKHDHVTHSTS